MKRRKRWSDSRGKRPHTCRVFERKVDGPLYAEWSGPQGVKRISLGYRDRSRALAFAVEKVAALVKGEADESDGRLPLARLLALYTEHQTPSKGAKAQADDARRCELFVRVLGADKEASKITRGEWERFIADRRDDRICPHGARGPHTRTEDKKPCPGPQGRTVRNRTIEADLRWLLAVLNWATTWQDHEGRYLLSENPARGFNVPKERNPRRPVATHDRFEALRAVSDQVTMEWRVGGKRVRDRSHLSEILDLVNEGRRIGAVLGLRFGDLDLDRTLAAPHGSITWRAELDKEDRAWTVPISRRARQAIDRIYRERPGVHEAPLFPAPGNPTRPMSRNLADAWLREAERLAGLEPLTGGRWHPYRRKAATEMKGAPDKDVMQLLGWSDPRSLKLAYQHADAATMLAALESRRELREVAAR